MEVNHPPGVHHRQKKWKEYFTEFIMMFLAVTLGFFAESYREHLTDKEKEKHYAAALSEDLKKDTSLINILMAEQELLRGKMDTALEVPMNRLKELPLQNAFYTEFIWFYSWVPVFLRNESSIIQLKSGGGFNVFRNQSVVDSITRLDNFFDAIKYNNDWYIKSCDEVNKTANQIIIIQKMPTQFEDASFAFLSPGTEVFANYDFQLIVRLYNTIRVERSMIDLLISMEQHYKIKSANLLNYLKKEYHLE